MFQKMQKSRYLMPRYKKTYYGFYVFAAIIVIILSLTL